MTLRRPTRLAACAAVLLALTACSSSESSTPATTDSTPAPADDESGAPGGDETGDSTTETTTPPTAPPTTAPPSTPPTTAPAATTPPSTAPPPTTQPVPDVDLTQFCFESEQAYLAARVIAELADPTPEQAEASLNFLVFTAEQSVAAAPAGFGEEANRFLELAREFDELFGRYDYDVEELDANENVDDFEPLFAEYDMIVEEQLVPFLQLSCGTELPVLDDQGEKIAPVIADASGWPLVAATNQSGDIRLLVPTDWSEVTGSLELDEVTFLQATPDTEQFEGTWNVPGVIVTVFYIPAGVAEPSLRANGTVAAADCTAAGSEPYADAVYSGELFLYESCSGTGTGAAVLAVTNDDGSIEVVAEFQFPDGVDRELLDQILATFVAGA